MRIIPPSGCIALAYVDNAAIFAIGMTEDGEKAISDGLREHFCADQVSVIHSFDFVPPSQSYSVYAYVYADGSELPFEVLVELVWMTLY